MRIVGTLAVALGLLGQATLASAESSFVVLGDMPYDEAGQTDSIRYMGSLLRQQNTDLVIHYGDLKGGGERCDDDLLEVRREIILGLVPGRVVFTPGDNDWTDCDRKSNGGYNELERLDRLRELFFTGPTPGGPDWQLVRQMPGYPENGRWQKDELQFVTLHVVGTSNGRRNIDLGKAERDQLSKKEAKEAEDKLKQEARERANARDLANVQWLSEAFAAAEDAKGLVVVMHTDPTDLDKKDRDHAHIACGGDVLKNCNPYKAIIDSLRLQAAEFERPVLLVHGSTKAYCLDKSYGKGVAPQLWRLNGPGDFVVIDAAVVTFDPTSSQPFEVTGLLSEHGVPAC